MLPGWLPSDTGHSQVIKQADSQNIDSSFLMFIVLYFSHLNIILISFSAVQLPITSLLAEGIFAGKGFPSEFGSLAMDIMQSLAQWLGVHHAEFGFSGIHHAEFFFTHWLGAHHADFSSLVGDTMQSLAHWFGVHHANFGSLVGYNMQILAHFWNTPCRFWLIGGVHHAESGSVVWDTSQRLA